MTTNCLVPAISDDVTRRRFLHLVGAAGLLAGCSSGPDTTGTPTAGPSFPRTVSTPYDGVVVIERAPRRIVAMSTRVISFVQPFLTKEYHLVGYNGSASPEVLPWIADQLTSVPSSPDDDGVKLEVIASWQPDLIIANGNVGDAWDPVRPLGPLVQLPETDIRATVTLLGEIFDRPDIAERILADVDAQIAAARRPTPVTAAVVVNYQDNGTVNFRTLGSEFPNFLARLNVHVASSASTVDGYEDVSLELAQERLDVDWVVIGATTVELQKALLADPVFAAVPAIAQGRYLTLSETQTEAGFPVLPVTVPILVDALAPVLRQP